MQPELLHQKRSSILSGNKVRNIQNTVLELPNVYLAANMKQKTFTYGTN